MPKVELTRSPDITKEEVERRLYQAYSLIISIAEQSEAADTGATVDGQALPMAADDATDVELDTKTPNRALGDPTAELLQPTTGTRPRR